MKVFIIGYMGVGKTTVGKKLAARLGVEFMDLDAIIVERTGLSISEIFERHGEASFRETERHHLIEVLHKPRFVLALGGGTPAYDDNMDLMLASGTVVHLTLHMPVLISRLKQVKHSRPLLANRTDEDMELYVTEHFADRQTQYSRAQLEYDASDLTAARLDRLVESIKTHQPTK